MEKLIEQDFQLDCEVEIVKAETEDAPWVVKGYASVEIQDAEDEILIVKGMDCSYLDTHGIINWNHQRTPQFLIGEITKSEKLLDKKPSKLYVEGELFKHQPEAVNTYNLMKSLNKSTSGRKMKMSIEGRAVQRQGKKIVKSMITGVALTMQPINPYAYAVLSKGMCKHPESDTCLGCTESCIGKGLDIDTNGKPLLKQSLEGAEKCQKCKGGCKSDKTKMMTKSEVVQCLQIKKGYSVKVAEKIYEFLKTQGGK